MKKLILYISLLFISFNSISSTAAVGDLIVKHAPTIIKKPFQKINRDAFEEAIDLADINYKMVKNIAFLSDKSTITKPKNCPSKGATVNFLLKHDYPNNWGVAVSDYESCPESLIIITIENVSEKECNSQVLLRSYNVIGNNYTKISINNKPAFIKNVQTLTTASCIKGNNNQIVIEVDV